MTFKMETSQFYDQSEPRQWKLNKIRHFSMGHVKIWNHFSLVAKCKNISMTFRIGIFQFNCKGDHKQVK